MSDIAPGKTSGLFWKFVTLVLAGFLYVSCSLFVDPPDEDPPPPDTEEEPSDSSFPCDPVSGSSIGALQFEGTISEEKIQVMAELEQLEDEGLQRCLQAITKKEVIVLTIWDLSRHTNPLVAEKAQVLAARFDLASYVDGEVDSEDEERLQDIVEFLLRIEPAQAKDILEQVSFETEEAGQIVEAVSSGTARVLIPTDSEGGDRYYVLASWDSADEESVNCLTKLFNEELSAQRTLEQEGQRMQELNGQRRVYWYSKEWALSLAESIEKCGAEASFVSGPGDSASEEPPVSDLSSEDEAASTSTTETDSDSGEQTSVTSKTDSSLTEKVQGDRKRRESEEAAPGSPTKGEKKRKGSEEAAPDTPSAGKSKSDTGDSVDPAPSEASASTPKPAEDASASGTVSDSSPDTSADPSGSVSTPSPAESASESTGKSPVSVRVQESSKSGGTAKIKVLVNSEVVEERVVPLGGSSPSPQPAPQSPSPEGGSAVTVEEPKGSDEGVLKKWDDNGNGRISCKEATKHGIAPVHADHPAFPFMKDRNGDGIICN